MWRPFFLPLVALTLLAPSALAYPGASPPPNENIKKFQPDGYSCASTTKWDDDRDMKPTDQWKNYTQVQAWRMARDIDAFCASLPDEFLLGGDYRVHVVTTDTEPYDPHPEETHWKSYSEDFWIGGEDHQNTEAYAYGREKQYVCLSVANMGEYDWSWDRESCSKLLKLVMNECDGKSNLLKNGGKVWNDWMLWRVESFSEYTMPKGKLWSKDLCERTAFNVRVPPVKEEVYWDMLLRTQF